jgi:GR25 family glycosyltransferase involved in LPS biosynthesis
MEKKYFDKIYIINLKKNIERKKKCLINLKNNNISNFEIVEAIDTITNENYDISYNNIITKFTRDFIKNNFSKGAFGCLLSHINCVIDAKKNNYKQILILEDDFILINNFEYELNELFANIDNNWDFIYLGKKQGVLNEAQKINDFVYKPNNKTWGTHSILIKNTLFDEIINFSKNIQGPIDIMLMKLYPNYNFYCVKKDLFITYEETSDVQSKTKIMYEKSLKLWNWDYSLYQTVESFLIKKIIIIGFKNPTHTHHYIHNMYYTFFKHYYPNLVIYWYDNDEKINKEIAQNSVIFCSPCHTIYSNIPHYNNIFYIFHIDFFDKSSIKKMLYFLKYQNNNIIFNSKNFINILCRERISDNVKYFEKKIKEHSICLPWFSNDLYSEIIKIKNNLTNIYEINNNKKYLCYMGSTWNLNINMIKELINFCINNKIPLILKGKMFDISPHDVKYMENIMVSSKYILYEQFDYENNGNNITNSFNFIDKKHGIKGLLPLQGENHNDNYISNRVFETLSKGYLLITNNEKTSQYYKTAIYNKDIGCLLLNYLEILNDKNLWISLMHKQIDEFLKKFYGYHNIKTIFEFITNVAETNNKLINFYNESKLFKLYFVKSNDNVIKDTAIIKDNENIRYALVNLNNYVVYNNIEYDIFLIEQLITCENYDILIDPLYKKKGFIINLCEKYKKSYTIVNK